MEGAGNHVYIRTYDRVVTWCRNCGCDCLDVKR